MKRVALPISKSIANRILLLQAIHRDPLMRVSSDMPDDVHVLHDALEALRAHQQGQPLTLYLKNCGTALRFLRVHLAECYPDEPITLSGDPRLMERDGKPTSQTDSALVLHGKNSSMKSAYVTMSRRLRQDYPNVSLERDWSAAAFWYEYVAIHGGELLLEGLSSDSLQGDRVVADIYQKHFGVTTVFTSDGAIISALKHNKPETGLERGQCEVSIDFSSTPDLYPAVALTCERLGINLHAIGTQNLRYKESDRLEAVRLHQVRDDHRMAMALIAADFPVSIDEKACVVKSYPHFVEQFQLLASTIQHITPIRGVNDDGLGKKHALSKLIHAATSDWLWLHDDDVVLPPVIQRGDPTALTFLGSSGQIADLYILPLRMESKNTQPSLLERLQIIEYTAIQNLTIRTARRGRPVMCSGANLIVRRAAWLECEPDLYPEIPSGDDMFLLEAMKRRGKHIAVLTDDDYVAVVRPLRSWKALWYQRTRWAGKAPHYSDRDIRCYGAITLILMLFQFLCPPLFLIYLPFEWCLVRRFSWELVLLSMSYPYYALACVLGGLFRQKKW